MNDIRAEFEKLLATMPDSVSRHNHIGTLFEFYQAGAALNAVSVPYGYVLVPIEPTKEMVIQAWNESVIGIDPSTTKEIYKAMINAAPKAKGGPS